MPDTIILDTGPLSNCVVSPAKPNQAATESQQCRQWLDDCEATGRQLIIPAIAYYEALRELELRAAVSQIQRLRHFCLNPNRFLSSTNYHLEFAAQLWAKARKAGKPTADRKSLDADVILAAQALSLGLSSSEFIIATTNPSHIAQFAACDLWTNIRP